MMKLAYAICIALGLGVGVTHAAGTDCQVTSSKMLDHLDQGDYAGATADFDGTMKAARDSRQAGRALAVHDATVWRCPACANRRRSAQQCNYVVVVTALHYGQSVIDAQVACDADGKIGGFYIKPHQ